MCNRAERGDTQKVLNLFGAKKGARFKGPIQIHPAQPGSVIRMENGERVLEQMTWGFPLAQKSKRTGKPLKPKPVNYARFDKLHTYFWKWAASKPEHRCLIPTARYCEACGEPGCMTETWLSVRDQPIFAWAGLWANSDEWGSAFTGVMTDNAPDLIDIHDRSPVIVDPADWDFWLTAPLEDL